MGFLHKGHAALLRASKKQNDISVLSIFVNPTQFGPNEDFSKYPRDLKHDESLARREQVDIIFYPSVDEMYPKGYATVVKVGGMSEVLCGKFRPNHFKGVATVVSKLLNIVQPHTLYLGQKDAQQAIILTNMVNDLNLPVNVKILPTVREKDGLAMSSRNTYLNSEERTKATVIYRSLTQAKQMIKQGERNSSAISEFIRKQITNSFPAKIDYVECVDSKTLMPAETLKGHILIALAAWFGKTRLIDNVMVKIS